MKRLDILSLAVAFCFLAAMPLANAEAAENKLTFSAEVGVAYDSNVFLAPDNEDSDTLTLITAASDFRTAVGAYGILRAKFSFTGNVYADYSDGDVITQDHSLDLTFEGDKYFLSFKDTFVFDSYPIDAVLLGRVDNWMNSLKTSVGAHYDKLGWEVGTQIRILQYPDIPAYDYTDSAGFLEGNYRYSEKTAFFLRATLGAVDYRLDEHNEADYTDIKAGIRGEITGKTTYELGAGWQKKDYDNSGTVADDSDFSGFSLSGNLFYSASEKTSFAFLVSYGPTESVTSNYNKVFFISGGVRHKFTLKIRGQFDIAYERSTNSVSSDNDFDKVTSNLNLSYELNERSLLSLKLKWESRSSDDPVREYDRLLTGLFYEVRF